VDNLSQGNIAAANGRSSSVVGGALKPFTHTVCQDNIAAGKNLGAGGIGNHNHFTKASDLHASTKI